MDTAINRGDQTESSVIGKRYVLLEIIGRGGMGVVYRALDRLNDQLVALKRVHLYGTELQPTIDVTRQTSVITRTGLLLSPTLSQSGTNLDVALAREFRMLASLRHPNIVSVLDYGFDWDRQPYYTMGLLDNAVTIVQAGFSQTVEAQVNLLIELLRALDYLHRRKVIHCDLKPANVLVMDGQIKVLDFGLAVPLGEGNNGSGSLLYIAPEALSTGTTSIESDLYAVGVIAYEMITGRVPFFDNDMDTMIDAILQRQPDTDITGRFSAILARLLDKNPQNRPKSARALISALSQLLDSTLPIEPTAIRESFLQAAQFTGRKIELNQLLRLLNDAINGRGSFWLIGGESGVGKSRLIEEVITWSLVKGAQVIRGQAIAEGSRPYQMWRPVLRWLSLFSALDDFEAGVLKALVPDIEQLLKRAIPDIPSPDPQTIQPRLFAVVERILRRQKLPLVIVLEDIHWEGEESLLLLARLSRTLDNLPVLILASYRDDERPYLASQMPTTNLIKLKRLDIKDIAAFANSILGDIGGSPFHASLYRETEGNFFFLVEALRFIIEDTGQREAIAKIPEHIFTGGMQRLVNRRLDRVPKYAQPLLHVAAIMGRQLDLGVLRIADRDVNLERWLTDCADASVLSVQDGQWRFMHDKLREGLLLNVTAEEKVKLHRRAAQSIDALYAQSPDHYPALFYHWSSAGDKNKELHYATLAGEQLLQSGAYREAVIYLRRALALVEEKPESTAGIARDRAKLERQIGETLLYLGHYPESQERLVGAVRSLGAAMPAAQHELALGIASEVFRQMMHRLLGVTSVANEPLQLEIVRTYELLAFVYYWSNQRFPALYTAFAMLNTAERIAPSPELARAFSSVCVAMGLGANLHRLARFYAGKAKETAEFLDNQPAMALCLVMILAYTMGTGQWAEIQADVDKAINISRRYNDYRVLRNSLVLGTAAPWYQGDFARSAQVRDELVELCRRSGNYQHQAFGLIYSAHDALLRDNAVQGQQILEGGA